MARGTLRFQVLDWEVEDIAESSLPEDLVRERAAWPDKPRWMKPDDRMLYAVTAYGRTEDGRTVAARLTQFQPFFYFRLEGAPCLRGKDAPRQALHHVRACLRGQVAAEVRGAALKHKTEFFGFSAGAKSDFLSVTFDSVRAMRRAANALRAGPGATMALGGERRAVVLYETRIEPLSRLLHARELPSAGWVELDLAEAEHGTWARTDTCVTLSYKSVSPVARDALAPAVVSAFDIECTSSGGDFPVAQKGYRKVANNLKDVLAAAGQHGATRTDKRELVKAVVLLTLGLQPSGAAAAAAAWLTERSPALLTRRVLGLARTKGAPPEPDAVLERIAPIADDLLNYGTMEVCYRDRSMPRTPVEQLEDMLNRVMPPLEGDPIIQIGVTSNRVGEEACFRRWICTLGTCSPVAGVEVVECETEAQLLDAFAAHILEVDPDMVTGYNIFGFDMNYMYRRACELGMEERFMRGIGRRTDAPARFVEKRLSSSALGDNVFWLVEMPGRVLVDLMKVVMRDHRLESYKLDSVALHFTGERKRDVSPQDIFRLQAGGPDDRAVVADYCVQDCELCNRLLENLRVLINAVAMASTSHVPMSYIFLRGQGVKILALVSYYCRKRDLLIRDLPKPPRELDADAPEWMVRRRKQEAEAAAAFGPEELVEVEGAIVLEPDTGFYVDDPVAVCDYASLYPSSILSHELSPDSRVTDDRFRDLPGYEYVDVSYDLYEGEGNAKRVSGRETLTFARRADRDVHDPDTLAIIPAVERILLTARKNTRRKMKHKRVELRDGRELVGELVRSPAGADAARVGDVAFAWADVVRCEDAYGPFMQAVLDGQQLSYKLLANSVYGQLGARTSDIRDPKVAACVTSVGRSLILAARSFIHERGGHVVYGDTDSVFCTFPVYDPDTGERLRGERALPLVIRKAMAVGREFTRTKLPAPHDLEYEKTFWPLLLLAKKKYVGNMYEDDPGSSQLKYMGIVLKRRDNAPIVRLVCKTLLDRLLNNLDVPGAVAEMLEVIDRVVDGRVAIEDLVITKTLRAEYKDRSRIAHAVLAQRIGARDPGNAPQVNDRIPMVHIRVDGRRAGEKVLQGDKVETPDHVLEHNLEIDYQYYLEDQIMNPTLQMLSAIVEQLPGHTKPPGFWERRRDDIERALKATCAGEDLLRRRTRELLMKERQAEAKRLVFDPKLARLRNKYNHQHDLMSFGFFFGTDPAKKPRV
eukprot:jgi/Tetstr1/454098/TSEL_041017.t1